MSDTQGEHSHCHQAGLLVKWEVRWCQRPTFSNNMRQLLYHHQQPSHQAHLTTMDPCRAHLPPRKTRISKASLLDNNLSSSLHLVHSSSLVTWQYSRLAHPHSSMGASTNSHTHFPQSIRTHLRFSRPHKGSFPLAPIIATPESPILTSPPQALVHFNLLIWLGALWRQESQWMHSLARWCTNQGRVWVILGMLSPTLSL